MAVALISIKNENKQLPKDLFGYFFEFGCRIKVKGLNTSGNEPMFLPFNPVIYSDMGFLKKVSSPGVACKVMKHSCNYCECHGDDNIIHIIRGQCYIKTRPGNLDIGRGTLWVFVNYANSTDDKSVHINKSTMRRRWN